VTTKGIHPENVSESRKFIPASMSLSSWNLPEEIEEEDEHNGRMGISLP
jgi:hypothetical protein